MAVVGSPTMSSLLCTQCGHLGIPKRKTQGSFVIEICLWLCMIVPGFFYSLWRLVSKQKVCAVCGSLALIPPNSPNAAKMLKRP